MGEEAKDSLEPCFSSSPGAERSASVCLLKLLIPVALIARELPSEGVVGLGACTSCPLLEVACAPLLRG